MTSFQSLKAGRSARQKALASTDVRHKPSESSSAHPTSNPQPSVPLPTPSTATSKSTRLEDTYDLPSSLEIRRTPSRGRGLFTTRHVKAGKPHRTLPHFSPVDIIKCRYEDPYHRTESSCTINSQPHIILLGLFPLPSRDSDSERT